MAQESHLQIINQLKSANRILILIGSGADLDGIGAGLALQEFLTRLDKKVQVLTPSPASSKLSFLSELPALQTGLTKNLVIEVGLEKAELSEFSYQKLSDKLVLYLTPKSGEFGTEDVAVRGTIYPFDLVISLGVSNLESLGEIYSNHVQLFFETPLINIDFRPTNDGFGQINHLNLASSSVSETVYDLLRDYDRDLIDERIATLLLVGIIFQTNSFQSARTSPNVLSKAAELVSFGAQQQRIITELYRSKSLGFLRLWGRVLARLKHDEQRQFVSSAVSAQDIEKSGASEADLDEIILELGRQLSFAKTFAFLYEKSSSEAKAYVMSALNLDFVRLFAGLQLKCPAPQVCSFVLQKPLTESEAEITSTVLNELAKHIS